MTLTEQFELIIKERVPKACGLARDHINKNFTALRIVQTRGVDRQSLQRGLGQPNSP